MGAASANLSTRRGLKVFGGELGLKRKADLKEAADLGELVEALLGEVEGVVSCGLGLDGEKEVVLLKGFSEPVNRVQVL